MTRISRITIGVLLAAMLGLMYVILQPYVQPVLFAIVLAVASAPLNFWLRKKLRSETRAALAATLLILMLVVVPVVFMGYVFTHQAIEVYQKASQGSQEGGGWGQYIHDLTEQPIGWVASKTGVPAPSIRTEISTRLASLSAKLVSWSGSFFSNAGGLIGNTFLCFIALFAILRYSHTIRRFLVEWMPMEREMTERLVEAIRQALIANVYGAGAVALAQGSLLALGMLIAGFSTFVFWGLIGTFCSFIPLIGPTIIWIPAAIYLAVKGMTWQAIFLAVWGILIVGMADNVIRPLIVQGRMNTNGIVIFFVLLGSVHAFGLIGLFMGPAVLSCLIALFEILREERERTTNA
jgi:predicted PurR-regulated permease PerM